ncbi:MAG: hypothetical protein M3Q80_00965 [bacterium]|nr:hypothetical protein [bacterium]
MKKVWQILIGAAVFVLVILLFTACQNGPGNFTNIKAVYLNTNQCSIVGQATGDTSIYTHIIAYEEDPLENQQLINYHTNSSDGQVIAVYSGFPTRMDVVMHSLVLYNSEHYQVIHNEQPSEEILKKYPARYIPK